MNDCALELIWSHSGWLVSVMRQFPLWMSHSFSVLSPEPLSTWRLLGDQTTDEICLRLDEVLVIYFHTKGIRIWQTDLPWVTSESRCAPSRLHIPHFHCLIKRTTYNESSIRRKLTWENRTKEEKHKSVKLSCTQLSYSSCPMRVPSHTPFTNTNTLKVLSYEPVTILSPLGDTETQVTGLQRRKTFQMMSLETHLTLYGQCQ